MRKGLSQLEDKVAVVTGAASGIGRCLAYALTHRGCHLALVDRDASGLQQLLAQLSNGTENCRISLHTADVGSKERMKEVADEVMQAHGGVHLLINNAGIGYEAAFPQTSLADWEQVMAVNFWGMVYGCHFFLPHLAKAEQAHIVNLSSLFGIVAMPGQTVYCASKFAVRGFSEALFEELRHTTIGLTVVHPGSVATNIVKTSKGDDPQLMQRIAEWYEHNGIPPEKAAGDIVAAIEKGKARLLITPQVVFADLVKRLLPMAGNKAIVDLVIRVLGLGDMRAKRRQQWQRTMVEGNPWN